MRVRSLWVEGCSIERGLRRAVLGRAARPRRAACTVWNPNSRRSDARRGRMSVAVVGGGVGGRDREGDGVAAGGRAGRGRAG